jgi:M6 family metalloprotease-like protein
LPHVVARLFTHSRQGRRGFALVLIAVGLSGLVGTPATAGKLHPIKRPGEAVAAPLRESDPAGREAQAPGIAPPPERVRRLPLDLGSVKPVWERRQLERRPSVLRAGVDTVVVRVAAIRVEFDEDRKGNLTTGDGRFMRVNEDSMNVFIDYPPHDEAYFQAHLTALDRYWSSMTYGCLRIQGEVFPRNSELDGYRLTDMADYHPDSPDEFFTVEGLTNFFRDAVRAADEDPDLVWSDHDVFFIMHAGSDWQNDVLQDSPFDIPTFSISLTDSDVVVTDSIAPDPPDTVTTGIVFPETSSQDGFLVALNGAIAHEMGHQLGLFDIYNVETFAPTVAFYDLMDSGNLASVFIPNPNVPADTVQVIGVLPTAVGAWSRWLVTFQFGINPTLLKGDLNRARLRAIQSRAGPATLPPRSSKWFQLPISDTEYFLVENRVDNLDGFYQGGFNTALDQDDLTGVVLGPAKADPQDDSISHNYDLLIDPGVLIWHIDERQALANLTQGRGINVIFEKRSVTIEEADGIVDIGSPFSFFPLGTDKETYHADNNADFTPYTRPNSDSNLRSPSNILITSIGERDTTVAMDISFSSKPTGWPMEVSDYGLSGRASLVAADTDGDGRAEMAAVGDSAAFLFRYDDRDGDGDVDLAGAWPAPLPDMRLYGQPTYTPTLGDWDGDNSLELTVVTDSGAVHCWGSDGTPYGSADSTGVIIQLSPEGAPAWSAIPADFDKDGADEMYLITLDGEFLSFDLSSGTPSERFRRRILPDSVSALLSTMAIGDTDGDSRFDGVISYVQDGRVHFQIFGADGRRPVTRSFELPEEHEGERVWVSLADLDRDPRANTLESFLATEGGWLAVVDSQGRVQPGWPQSVDPPIHGPAAFGDLDQDGLLEIAFMSEARSVHALNYNGTEIPGFPASPEFADFPTSFGGDVPGPAIADVDGDGRLDIVVGLMDFTVRAIAPDGKEVDGFPIVTGGQVRSTPAILDANGDGRLELYVHSADGHVYSRILAGLASDRNPVWSMFGGGPRLHGSYADAALPNLVSTEGKILNGPVHVYPNPLFAGDGELTVRYTLGTELAAAAEVHITMYNLAGEAVDSRRGSVHPNTQNIVTIPGDRLVSGVYICNVRARSGDVVETRLERFAVIR